MLFRFFIPLSEYIHASVPVCDDLLPEIDEVCYVLFALALELLKGERGEKLRLEEKLRLVDKEHLGGHHLTDVKDEGGLRS